MIAVFSGLKPTTTPRAQSAEIVVLRVLPDRQGQGIGRVLLTEASKELATMGFTKLQIGVLTANVPARRFYEAMGGHEIGQRTIAEQGHLLPGTVYEWTDIAALASDVRESS